MVRTAEKNYIDDVFEWLNNWEILNLTYRPPLLWLDVVNITKAVELERKIKYENFCNLTDNTSEDCIAICDSEPV